MDSYKTGNANDQILLSVIIGSTGICQTGAYLLDHNLVRVGSAVAVSNNNFGDISPVKKIGTAASITGLKLSITTVVNLTGADINTRKMQAAQIAGKYTLDKGTDGYKEFFGPDTVVDRNGDYTSLVLTKQILLY